MSDRRSEIIEEARQLTNQRFNTALLGLAAEGTTIFCAVRQFWLGALGAMLIATLCVTHAVGLGRLIDELQDEWKSRYGR